MIALFVARGWDGSGNHPAKHPERVEHPEAVFPDIDPGADDAQVAVLLMHPNPPAFARKGEAGSEPGDPATGDLDRADHDASAIGPARGQTVSSTVLAIHCISATPRIEVRREDANRSAGTVPTRPQLVRPFADFRRRARRPPEAAESRRGKPCRRVTRIRGATAAAPGG